MALYYDQGPALPGGAARTPAFSLGSILDGLAQIDASKGAVVSAAKDVDDAPAREMPTTPKAMSNTTLHVFGVGFPTGEIEVAEFLSTRRVPHRHLLRWEHTSASRTDFVVEVSTHALCEMLEKHVRSMGYDRAPRAAILPEYTFACQATEAEDGAVASTNGWRTFTKPVSLEPGIARQRGYTGVLATWDYDADGVAFRVAPARVGDTRPDGSRMDDAALEKHLLASMPSRKSSSDAWLQGKVPALHTGHGSVDGGRFAAGSGARGGHGHGRGHRDGGGDRGGPRRDSYRDEPRGAYRDEPRGAFRDEPRGAFRDEPRGAYRDEPRGAYRDEPRGAFRDEPRGAFRDEPRGAFRDEPRGAFRDEPRGAFRDEPRGGYRGGGRGAFRGGRFGDAPPNRR